MATRTRKPAAAKPAVSPAQIIEDGPMIGHVAANDLATLEAEPTRDELIRAAAHRRFVERGMTPGDPVQDWLEAEAEVDRKAAG